jgi:uncharacterized membrane protein (UPF0127 family)
VPPLARRLRRLPRADLGGPLDVRLAATPRARLLGLAYLAAARVAGAGLLLPRTRSIHTFGMRFALDLVWLDRDGVVVRVDRAVAPRRLRACARASAVIELPAGTAPSELAAGVRALARRPARTWPFK